MFNLPLRVDDPDFPEFSDRRNDYFLKIVWGDYE
jgi:hypothetical protein